MGSKDAPRPGSGGGGPCPRKLRVRRGREPDACEEHRKMHLGQSIFGNRCRDARQKLGTRWDCRCAAGESCGARGGELRLCRQWGAGRLPDSAASWELFSDHLLRRCRVARALRPSLRPLPNSRLRTVHSSSGSQFTLRTESPWAAAGPRLVPEAGCKLQVGFRGHGCRRCRLGGGWARPSCLCPHRGVTEQAGPRLPAEMEGKEGGNLEGEVQQVCGLRSPPGDGARDLCLQPKKVPSTAAGTEGHPLRPHPHPPDSPACSAPPEVLVLQEQTKRWAGLTQGTGVAGHRGTWQFGVLLSPKQCSLEAPWCPGGQIAAWM